MTIIATENLNIGTTAWKATNGATTEIGAYIDQCSYNTGDTLTMFVSTQVGGTTYTINIYRQGYYGGTGGRLMTSIAGNVGVAQGYANSDGSLTNCPTAVIDGTTHLCEARWTSSYTLVIPSNWITGSYLIQLVDANGKQYYCHFILKGNSNSTYVVVRADSTDAAYNFWGGHSLYTSNSISGVAATKVSFDRPSIQFNGSDGAMYYEHCVISFLEKNGYDLSYLSSVDMHVTPSQLLTHKAYISIGHDEYWSKSMRNGVEAAIAAGINALFTSANTCYWQIRFETGGLGGANRTVVGYKVGLQSNASLNEAGGLPAPSTDPQYGVDNTVVTCQWRDPILNRPENSMIGIMYSSFVSGASNVAWKVDANPDPKYLTGTGLVASSSYGVDCVGYEWDRVFPFGSPNGLKIIGTSPITDVNSKADTSNTTWYQAPSGALVFALGSVGWTWALDPFRWSAADVVVSVPMQALFQNIMAGLVTAPRTGPVFSGFTIHS